MSSKKGKEGALLAGLLIKIFKDLGLEQQEAMNRLLDKYVLRQKKENDRIAKLTGRKPANVNRNHVISKIFDTNLTWKTFLLAIFKILNVRKMKITIELEHANGTTTKHDYKIENRGVLEDGNPGRADNENAK